MSKKKKKKFKRSPSHSKAAESFVEGSSVKTGEEKEKSSSKGRGRPPKTQEEMEVFTTRLQKSYLKKVRAVAYINKDKSQREIIEKALDLYFDANEGEVEKALKIWRELER